MNKKVSVLSILLIVFMLLTAITGCGSNQGASSSGEEPPAAPFPEKNIIAIYHGEVGSGGDVFLRNMGVSIQPFMNGNSLVVENRVGASGGVAMSYAFEQKPDGYTVLGTSTSEVLASVLLDVPVKYDQFDYLCGLVTDPEYFYCPVDAPYDSIKELVEYAKAHPGEMNWGFPMAASSEAMAQLLLIKEEGLEVNTVVFDGGPECFTSLLGGHIDVSVGGYNDFKAQYEAGNIKVLATTNPASTRILPDIPSLVDEGYDISMEKARGIVVPKGVPAEIQEQLCELFKKALDDPQFVSSLEADGCEIGYMSGKEVKDSYDKVYKYAEENLK